MTFFIIIVFLIYFLSKRFNIVSVWYEKLSNQPYNYIILITLIVVGFFAKLDYSDRWGCIVSGEQSVFDFKNILFSSISLTTISLSFISKNRKLKLSFIIIELAFWVFKLFYYKGGYVSGLGIIDPFISSYDTITLAVRLVIISALLRPKFKTKYALMLCLIIMSFKVFVFPTQLVLVAQWRQSLERSEQTKKELKGKWEGIYEYDFWEEGAEKQFIDSVQIEFDNNIIILHNFKEKESTVLVLEFTSEYCGNIISKEKDDWDNHYSFWVSNVVRDSLYITLTQTSSARRYEFSLKKTLPNSTYM